MGYADTINRVMLGDFTDATEDEKARAAKELIQVCSVAASAMTIQPIPLLDTALLAPIQIGMVQGIGKVHGYKLDRSSIVEILSTFGASLVAQSAMMAAAKLVPFFGWVVTLSMAYALTHAIGEVSNYYFKNGRGTSREELKSMFDRVYREKKAEKEASNRKNSSLKDRLTELQEAKASGLLTDEEFERKKEELLRSF